MALWSELWTHHTDYYSNYWPLDCLISFNDFQILMTTFRYSPRYHFIYYPSNLHKSDSAILNSSCVALAIGPDSLTLTERLPMLAHCDMCSLWCPNKTLSLFSLMTILQLFQCFGRLCRPKILPQKLDYFLNRLKFSNSCHFLR